MSASAVVFPDAASALGILWDVPIVLIVDDDPDVRLLFRLALADLAAELVDTHPDDAFELAAAGGVAAVVMEWTTERASRLGSRLLENDATAVVPVVVVMPVAGDFYAPPDGVHLAVGPSPLIASSVLRKVLDLP